MEETMKTIMMLFVGGFITGAFGLVWWIVKRYFTSLENKSVVVKQPALCDRHKELKTQIERRVHEKDCKSRKEMADYKHTVVMEKIEEQGEQLQELGTVTSQTAQEVTQMNLNLTQQFAALTLAMKKT